MSEQDSIHSMLDGIQMGVGTWAWGDRLIWGYGKGYSENDIKDAFDVSVQNGIRLFDTAEIYGQGKSEQMLGELLRSTSEPVLVATKFMPFPWRLSRESLLRALRGSLKRLGLEQVDLYQMHQPFPPVNVETWMAGMVEAVQAGLTRSVGVSNYDQTWTQRAHDALAREGIHLAANQVEYSLINRKIEKNGLLQKCRDLEIRVIAYSPLGMGLLTGKYSTSNPPRGIRSGAFNHNRHLLEKLGPLLTLMKRIGSDHAGKNPAQIAINWVICKGALPIPGAKNLTQAEQNLGALDWRLTDEEIRVLDEASDQLTES